MSEHELEQLLGAFAADTLTADEKQRLYRAALQDQQIFDALADEQALKELLADPAVRRRLLDALNRPSGPGAISWLDRLRRPATLVYAGGLAAAALAVVLGIRIYRDSLKEAGPTVATEESAATNLPAAAPPVLPPAPSPLTGSPEGEETVPPAINLPKKSAPAGKSAEPSQAVDVPAAPPTPEPNVARPMAAVPLAGTVAPAAQGSGARALFYQTIPASAESRRRAGAMQETPSGIGTPGEGAPQGTKQMERTRESVRKPDGKKQTVGHPIGLRYSLIMKGPGGIDLEVDPTTPVGKDDAPRLSVQTNEDGYLSVHHTRSPAEASTLLFPASGEGRVAGRQPVAVALDTLFDPHQTAEQARLLLVFSRSPHDVNSPKPPGTPTPPLLIERVDPSQPGAPAEQAVYVVDPMPAASLSIEVPLTLRP